MPLPEQFLEDPGKLGHMLALIDFLTDLCLMLEQRASVATSLTFIVLLNMSSDITQHKFLRGEQVTWLWQQYNQLTQMAREYGLSMEDQLGFDVRAEPQISSQGFVPLFRRA